ncbi:MAG: heavy metal-responsive transcriptional regulator [Acidobacteriota bacterium]|nr:heavy metal-responsive transcriptional regulator [Acidobacteriota bacterium]
MPRPSTEWRVSELAADFNINPRTIRYYERIGLLAASTRTAAGYRLYSPTDRDRLRFILKAKATGLTLEEIREVLALRRRGVVPCPRVLALIEAKLGQLDRHVQALLEFRDELVGLQREAAGGTIDGCICGLIEEHESHHKPEALRLATEVLSHRPVRAR